MLSYMTGEIIDDDSEYSIRIPIKLERICPNNLVLHTTAITVYSLPHIGIDPNYYNKSIIKYYAGNNSSMIVANNCYWEVKGFLVRYTIFQRL